jgi:hypothetical protein
MRSHKFLALLTACWMLAACRSMPAAPSVPAHLFADKTDEACIVQMEKAIQGASPIKVRLTSAAFATQDSLSLVASTGKDSAGQNANGALLSGPDNFRLTLSGNHCLMTRENTKQVTNLTACTCVALP